MWRTSHGCPRPVHLLGEQGSPTTNTLQVPSHTDTAACGRRCDMHLVHNAGGGKIDPATAHRHSCSGGRVCGWHPFGECVPSLHPCQSGPSHRCLHASIRCSFKHSSTCPQGAVQRLSILSANHRQVNNAFVLLLRLPAWTLLHMLSIAQLRADYECLFLHMSACSGRGNSKWV